MEIDQRDEFGRFLKGIVPWNKDKHGYLSEDIRKRISEARKKAGLIGRMEEGLKKGRGWNKGTKGVLKPNKTSFKPGHRWPNEIYKRIGETNRIKPNLDSTENLGYVLGLLFGDGFVYKNSGYYRICLEVTNRTIALNFLDSLKIIGLNPFIQEIMPTNGIGKQKKYRVTANSQNFGIWYKNLSAQNLHYFLSTKESIVGFIKGFYEAEGNLSINKNNYLSIHIHNTDIDLLNILNYLAQKVGVELKMYGPYNNSGSLSKNPKPLYRLSATGQKAYVFINTIKPNVKTLGLQNDNI